MGNSRSGKTTLAKILAARHSLQHPVIVYDPNESQGWPGVAKKFSAPGIFFKNVQQVQRAVVYIDEAKTLWDYDAEAADELVYRGRHRGFALVLIAQRTRMVAPNGRNQCSRIFAFRQQKDDAATLAQEYHEELEECRTLEIGQFLASDGYKIWRGCTQPTNPPTIVWQAPAITVDTDNET